MRHRVVLWLLLLSVVPLGCGRSDPPSPGPQTPSPEKRVPGAPTTVTAQAGVRSAVVSWRPPADDGGSALLGYTVMVNPGGTWVSTTGETSVTFPGLLDATEYTFTVTALNAVGKSPASQPSPAVRTAGLPGAPLEVTAEAGLGSALVAWQPPSSDGGSPITEYVVKVTPGDRTERISGETGALITGLEDATGYTFTVWAANAVGAGPASEPSAETLTLPNVPAPPTSVVAETDIRSAVVRWVAPTRSGGRPILRYVVSASPGGASVTVTDQTQARIADLANGTAYSFVVRAINEIGESQPSEPSSEVTTPDVPEAPTQVMAVPEVGSAWVSWTAPSRNGGSPITGYRVVVSPGGYSRDFPGPQTTGLFNGLLGGPRVTFRVHALNAVGEGPASDPSAEVRIKTTPSAPRAVAATAGVRSVQLSWQPPEDDGGFAVRSYTVLSQQPWGIRVTTTTPSTEITGLDNGRLYFFTVQAESWAGLGEASEQIQVTTPNVPSAPLTPTATPGADSVTLTWGAPLHDGGRPVTAYRVRIQPGDAELVTTELHAQVTALLKGVAYTFRVSAVNAVGLGAEAVTIQPVELLDVPGEPTTVTARAGVHSATVRWQPPVRNGGLPIQNYTVTLHPGGQTVTTEELTAEFTELEAHGTTYTFTVHATNALGDGPSSLPVASVCDFTTPPAIPMLELPQPLVSADFNEDGAPDLVVGSTTGKALSLLLNQGNATFAPRVDYVSEEKPYALATGDFNRDGHTDVVMSHHLGSVVLLPGKGDGSFQASRQLIPYIGRTFGSIVAADLNGDSLLDLAMTATDSSPYVHLLLGNGDGTFTSGSVPTVEYPHPAVGDLDGDGRMDLVTTSYIRNVVFVHRSLGNGLFSDPVSYAAGDGAGAVVLEDVNADDHLDVITTNYWEDTVSVFLGQGNGGLRPPIAYGTGFYPFSVAVGDVTDDGLADLVVLNTDSYTLSVLPSRGDGTFSERVDFPTGAGPLFLQLRDFNADGRLDIAFTHSDNTVGIRINACPQ